MTKQIIQVENINSLDFKNEILNGVKDELERRKKKERKNQ